VVPTNCIAYQASTAPAPGTVVATEGAGSACETVQVELLLTDVTDVQTVDFDVSFDPSMASYEGVSLAGSVLVSDGANVNVLENEAPGEVSIDLSRFNTGIDFDGTGMLVRLIFSKVASPSNDSGPLSFSATQVFGSEMPPEEKPGIQWHGGTMVIE
jgi:hypothetical protein